VSAECSVIRNLCCQPRRVWLLIWDDDNYGFFRHTLDSTQSVLFRWGLQASQKRIEIDDITRKELQSTAGRCRETRWFYPGSSYS